MVMIGQIYTYNPSQIGTYGKDRMRFELGDVMVGGGAETAALSDGEIEAMLAAYPQKWKRAKLALVESVCRRFAYEVETAVGPLKLGLQARADAWRAMHKELKAEAGSFSVPTANSESIAGAPYFNVGMMDNPRGQK